MQQRAEMRLSRSTSDGNCTINSPFLLLINMPLSVSRAGQAKWSLRGSLHSVRSGADDPRSKEDGILCEECRGTKVAVERVAW